MIRSRSVRGLIVAAVCCGMLLPQSGLMAGAQPKTGKSAVRPIQIPKAMDVVLGEGGVLSGRFVDRQGKGIENAPVAIYHDGKEVASTMTDAKGQFVVKNLRSGDHAVVNAQYIQQCRLWTDKSAPPSAKTESVIVASEGVVRGQDGYVVGMGPDIITTAVLLFGIAGVTLGIIAVHEIDEVEEMVEEINASP